MKTYLYIAIFGFIAGLFPATAQAEGSMFGKFYVASVSGNVEITSDGRIWDLKKGDVVLARGAVIKTGEKSNAVIVFSNQTVMVIDEKSEFRVRKFDQEPFSPNNNLLIEPSNSQTLIALMAGQVTVDTPQLLSGTSLIIETPHASVSVLNTQSGSEKIFVEVTEKQTHAGVVAGLASVKPRLKDGSFVSLGRPVKVGEQAFVKYTLNGSGDTDNNAIGVAVTAGGSASGAVGTAGSVGELTVTKVSGQVQCVLPEGTTDFKEGDHRLATGVVIRTGADSKATVLFSNGSSYVLAEKTEIKVDKFTQAIFSPNNNLDIEPSNSDTHITLRSGNIDITTPQLLSGTHLVCETVHSAISILNLPSGGEKASVSVNDKLTHFILLHGRASVQPREADGTWSSSYFVNSNQQAFIKYAVGAGAANASNLSVAQMGAAASAVTVEPLPVVAEGATVTIVPGMATVLKITGSAHVRLPGQPASASSDVTLGAQIPVNAVITTGAGSEIYLQAFPGAIAIIREKSEVMIEKLDVTLAGGAIMKQSALFDLHQGTILSDIDPAKKNTNDYGIRTPKGIAHAHGTAFTVQVYGDDPVVATTADTVTFTSPGGESYSIQAGSVIMTPPGGTPQAPIPLSQAVAANAAFGTVLQNAVSTIANMVQNNIGNLPANSAANLMAQIVSVASTALPAQAASFASQGVTAVTASTSSTTSNSIGAAAAITAAAVSASPAQASQVAAAAAQAAPGIASTMAAAAAGSAPSQAASIATSVLQTMNTSAPGNGQGGNNGQGNGQGGALRAVTQAAASVAAAVTSAVPAQAASVATAMMQMVTQSDPQATGGALTRSASALANAISSSAPSQASPVATALMQVVSQADPTGNSAAQAAAITSAANQGSAAGTAAANSNAGGNGSNGAGGGSTASNGAGGNSSGGGSSNGGGGSNSQATSIIVTQLNGADNTGTSVTPAANTGTGGGTTAQPTSIIVTQLNGGQMNQINSNLQLSQSASSSVTFTSGGDAPTSTPTVTANPIVSTVNTTDSTSNATH